MQWYRKVNPVNSDPDGDALTIISVSPTNGTAGIVGGTNVLFTPTANFSGTATVGYTIIDGHGGTNSAMITINVAATPQADVAVFVYGPTNSVTQGNAINYTNIVINYGPATATNVVLKNLLLPTNVVFVSASGGGVFSNASHTVTWPKVPTLANGASTNYTVTVTITNTIASNLILTNIASATNSTADPNPTNNTGVLPVSQWNVTIVPVRVSALTGAPVYNPQISSYEESVTVTNFGQATIVGMRLYPVGLRAGKEFLVYATGTNAGQPYVQFNAPLAPNNSVTFQVEIYSSDNRVPTNTFRVEVVVATPAVAVSGSDLVIRRIFFETVQGADRPVIEFDSVPGRIYAVLYSDDSGATWKTAAPFVTATTAVVQWVDSGPPKTDIPATGFRLYRVVRWQ